MTEDYEISHLQQYLNGRLVEIKAKYGPDNLFRINQNIKPAKRKAMPV